MRSACLHEGACEGTSHLRKCYQTPDLLLFSLLIPTMCLCSLSPSFFCSCFPTFFWCPLRACSLDFCTLSAPHGTTSSTEVSPLILLAQPPALSLHPSFGLKYIHQMFISHKQCSLHGAKYSLEQTQKTNFPSLGKLTIFPQMSASFFPLDQSGAGSVVPCGLLWLSTLSRPLSLAALSLEMT